MSDRFTTKFVRDENIKDFRKKIEIETEPVRLAMLKTLLKEEEAASQPPPPDKTPD